MKNPLWFGLCLILASCGKEPAPEELVPGRDLCASCRMAVSEPRFAAQITAPGELPLFFDEPGCLGDFVKAGKLRTSAAVAWVADHRTKAWVRADRAVYTRVPTITSPMNHQVVAHETAASRDADPDSRGGRPVELQEIFGPERSPRGSE